MRGVLLATSALICGCGSSSGSLVERPATQTIHVSNAGRLTISPSSGPTVNALAFPLEEVWRVLPAVFDSLGVPVTRIDPAARIIGNDGFKLRQRLAKTALSRYLDCGETQVGPNADSYDVYLIVLTQLRPAPNGTSLATTVEASARPITFSQAYSGCRSRGVLESRLIDLVKARLQT